VNTILSQAAASGVSIQNNTQGQVKTNQFFVEQARALTVTAGESELVDFLYRLGTGDSLVRVRGLALRPDPPRHALSANLTLVASYKKKALVRAAHAAASQLARTPRQTGGGHQQTCSDDRGQTEIQATLQE
jgi:hypothetical protein